MDQACGHGHMFFNRLGAVRYTSTYLCNGSESHQAMSSGTSGSTVELMPLGDLIEVVRIEIFLYRALFWVEAGQVLT